MEFKSIIEKGLPSHLAIILDGNGRWANQRMMPRNMGHRRGAINLKDIVLKCDEIGIKYLTVYCFSTENWSRPKEEVDYLMQTPVKYYKKYKNKIADANIRVKVIGRKDRFSSKVLDVINDIENLTKDKTGITLALCIDYGAQDEIINATKKIAQKVKNNELNIDDININEFESNLFTADFPPLDLMIRTSGEIRISNFLLWQIAYSELYFTDVYWPDFNEEELYKALTSFQSRNRRFGGLKETKKK